jgi:hypothetical protein
MRAVIVTVLIATVAACAPSTQMVQHGNEWVQVTQTYGLFGSNVVERSKCAQGELVNGFCPAERKADYSHTYAKGPGAEIVSATILGGAILGGAALIRPNDARMTQSVTGSVAGSPIRTSTLLINAPVPGGVAP